jgi:hypothetical protein
VERLQAVKTRDREFSGVNALIHTKHRIKKHGFNLFRLDTPKGAQVSLLRPGIPLVGPIESSWLKYQTPPEFRI